MRSTWRISAPAPQSARTSARSSAATPTRIFTETVTSFALRAFTDRNKGPGIFEIIFPGPGRDHGGLPAVGIDLVDHLVAECICDGRKGGRGTAPQVNAGDHIAGFELINLCTQRRSPDHRREIPCAPRRRRLTVPHPWSGHRSHIPR